MNDQPDGRTHPRGRSLGDQDEAQLGGPLSVLHALERAAGGVERLPIMRRGERPSNRVTGTAPN